VGEYADGMPNGFGTFLYPNGERLEGEWSGSSFPETGIYTYGNGDRYGGSWLKGKKHGHGSYYFANGAKYQGAYVHGEPHGQAVFVTAQREAFAEVRLQGGVGTSAPALRGKGRGQRLPEV